jgi:putative PIG3 family NAD(P)H quinone oxidoreductase
MPGSVDRAVVIRGAGDVEVLVIEDRPRPQPGAGEVLVAVAAAGLNRADCLQRRGMYPAPPGAPADIPGLEFAGEVAALGPATSDWKLGDRVMGIAGGGAMASHIAAHQRTLVRVPDRLDLAAAAAVPEVFMTAFDALVLQAGLAMGDDVVIHAAGSGVGTAAIQLVARAGARAIGTSRTASKLDRCRELGLAVAIEVADGTFADKVRGETGGRGAAIILDCVGAAYLEENLRALCTGGRLIVVGLLGGASGTLPLRPLLARRARVAGTVLRSRPLEEKAALAQAFAARVVPLLADGRLVPVVDAVLPMDQIQDAHRRMEQNQTFGKIVLTW